MKHPVAALLLCASSAHATLTCTPLEYAAYKDQAKTSSGRWSLAIDACTAKRRADLPTATPASAKDCDKQRATIMAVLENARDANALQWVSGGCEGEYPKASAR